MEAKAILYHSNEAEKCDMFITKTDYLIESQNLKDDKWLGTGMYFWDNLGNAKWWNEKQRQRNSEKIYSIAIANVNLENLLDLTDPDVYFNIENIWKMICIRERKNTQIPLGNKLNILWDVGNFSRYYDVVKVFGRYINIFSGGLFDFDINSKTAEPTMTARAIYNVKSSDCIVKKAYLEE